MPGAFSSTRRVSVAAMSPLPSIQRLAHRHLDDPARAPDEVALLDVGGLAHQRDADVVLFEVQHHAVDAARELDELAGHRVLQAVDARDPVADREHGAGLRDVDLAVVLLDLALQDVGDLAGLDVHPSVLLVTILG
jgi:hypothetical protein